MTDRVLIFDTTLRDGEQSPGFAMTAETKVKIATMLEDLGVDIIEAGFPASSANDFAAVNKVASAVKDVIVAGLCRARKSDIDAVIEATKSAKRSRVHMFLATSPIHMQYKLKMTPEQVLASVEEHISYARRFCPDVEFSAEDATRSEDDFLCRVYECAIKAGATTLNFPDTVGYITPAEYADKIKMLLNRVPNIDKAIISTHCHDDLGLALANSLAGVQAGARQVECTINGIGERAGNAALEEVVMAFHVRGDVLPFTTNINTKKLLLASRTLCDLTGSYVQPNKAIVGANAFAHASGVHQDGMLKCHGTYEVINPAEIGLEESKIVLGKHSGRKALSARINALGFSLEGEALDGFFKKFKEVAGTKKQVSDEDLKDLLKGVGLKPVERIKFVSLNVSGGVNEPHKAQVEIDFDGTIKTVKAVGRGPVDACFKALATVIPHNETKLHSYNLEAIDEGSDARGEVRLELLDIDKLFKGYGVDADIVAASCKAYIDALNKMLLDRE